MKRRNTVTL